MSENQTNQTKITKKNNAPQRNQLWGKVVLLIGNDTSILQNLVAQLALKGADIALLCLQMPREKAQKLKESVQPAGTRLFLIEQPDYQNVSPSRLIDSIVAKMGHLDIFIDLSAQKPESGTKDFRPVNGSVSPFSGPNWQFTQAALEEITHA